jgi:hypothetical protein
MGSADKSCIRPGATESGATGEEAGATSKLNSVKRLRRLVVTWSDQAAIRMARIVPILVARYSHWLP